MVDVCARLGESPRVALRLATGTVQRELGEHTVVVRFGAQPDRLHARVRAAWRG